MLVSKRGWNWDDEDGERAIPHVTRVRLTDDGLKPSPPAGWLKVLSYDTTPPINTPHTAVWMYCIATVQGWERENNRVRQAHMISRDVSGRRVLIVHPDLEEIVVQAIDGLNGVFIDCSCGGYDCIEHTLQLRAAKLFARRALKCVDPRNLPELLEEEELPPDILDWADLPMGRRMQLVRYQRLDPDLVLDASCWTDAIASHDASLFEGLAQSMHAAAGLPTWWEDLEASLIDRP